jgi:hypothetical protein
MEYSSFLRKTLFDAGAICVGGACWVDFEQRYLDWVCAGREVVFGFGLLFGTNA